MKLLVLLPEAERAAHGVEQKMLTLDWDALLKLPFDELVALEDAMAGGLSLSVLNRTMHEYTARHLRAVAYLALRQAGKTPDWATFKPNPAECLYVVAPGDADPPARSGASSRKAPARTSSKSARTSRSSTASRRTG